MQTMVLARISKATIIALDNHQPFLDILMKNAAKEGYADRTTPRHQSMLEMDFKDGTFDVIWSEGALYFMGFQKGLHRCHQLLKKNGYLAVTEAVLLLPNLPKPVQEFWDQGYPDIKDIQTNISVIESEGFTIVTHFTLPKSSWIDTYYAPMKERIFELKKKYQGNMFALRAFEHCEKEINIYKKYSDFFGYEFFVIQKT